MNWPIGWTSLEPMNHEHFQFWQKSSAAALQGDGMREVWFDKDPATPSRRQEPSEQFAEQCEGAVPALPQDRAHEGRHLGARQGGACGVQGLRKFVPAQEGAEIVDMQSSMPERVGAGMCESPLGFIPRVEIGVTGRVDRLKAIGNGQVPICAAAAFLQLRERIDQ